MQDETTIHANIVVNSSWELKGQCRLRTKSKGKGIMRSELISEDHRFLELTDEEYEAFKAFVPAGHAAAGEVFEWSKVRMWDGLGEYNDAPLWLKEGEELPRRTRLEFLYGKSA